MAKKAKARKTSAKKANTRKPPKPKFRSDADRASAIVAHVLTHFGGGYAAERQTENPGAPPANLQIFKKPTDLSNFHSALMESTMRNLAKIDWETNQPLRDQICQAAFAHGMLARQTVVAQQTATLTLQQVLNTLQTIQASHCPGVGGSGGGPICDF